MMIKFADVDKQLTMRERIMSHTVSRIQKWGWSPFNEKEHKLFKKFGWCNDCKPWEFCIRCKREIDRVV